MKITSLQTIAPLLLKGLDKTTIFYAGPELELEPVIDGDRRDIVIRRPGYEDFLVWQTNIAGSTVDTSEVTMCPCAHCDRTFPSLKAVGAHARRAHPEQFT